MSTPYLGEIRMFAGNFAPRNNAYCAGQLLAISQNTALFSLLGTYYGGNGTSNFALPDLRGRVPLHQGNGPGLTPRVIGELDGTETVTLTSQQIPQHTHLLSGYSGAANATSPQNAFPAQLASPFIGYYVNDADKTGSPLAMNAAAVTNTGGGQPHNNIMSTATISFIIALNGIFPSRN